MEKRRRGRVESPGQSILHFTDREDEQELFERLLNRGAGEHLPVLSFYGVGGTGKTWLLRKLRERLPPEGGAPYAHLDFSVDREGEVYHRDHAAALGEIGRQLGVECPRFEVARSVMLWKQGVREMPSTTAGQAASTGWQIAVSLGQDLASAMIPGVNVAGKVLEKLGEAAGPRLRTTALGRWLESRGGNQALRELAARTAQEISAELVYYLAEDLQEQLPARTGSQCRAVLFLDTFEDLFRGLGPGNAKERAARQQWIQELYRALLDDAQEPHGTVLFVVAGRDQLVWDEDFDDPRYLDQHRVGGLSRKDARRFLASCGIEDAALQEAILRVSRDTDTGDGGDGDAVGYHPFSLGLCADTVVSERARGAEPDAASFALSPGDLRALVERFLASFGTGQEAYRPWMLKLALPPRWDEQAARKAYSPVDDAQQDAAWDALLSYSFVQPPRAGEPWWSLHVRMRDTLRAHHAENPERERRDHHFWQEHWHARSRHPADARAGLAWYHLYCLDPADALAGWRSLAVEARQQLRMAEHYELLGWWAPTGLLERGAVGSALEAEAAVVLGAQLQNASLGDLAANLHQAIRCYEAAALVFAQEERAAAWATAMLNLGTACAQLPVGDREANLARAIGCYRATLAVFTEETAPGEWARTMHNLGSAYGALPLGDRAANLHHAREAFEAALRVYDEQRSPRDRALTLTNLGLIYQELPLPDHATNLARAIECYQEALRLASEEESPIDRANTLNNLGNAYQQLPLGNRTANLRRAIECYQEALHVRTEEAFPNDWATTQNNLGIAYSELMEGDRAANLARAIDCYRAALRVFREESLPQDWAMTLNNLGRAYESLPLGDRAANLRRAIECYEAAQRVYTEEALPQEWAGTMHNLGNAYRALPAEDGPASVHRAIESYRAALRVRTEATAPYEWAITQNNLGFAYSELTEGDFAANLQMAIECYRGALRVLTEQSLPQDWAMTMNHLGNAYQKLPMGDRAANLRLAIDCFEAALRVRTAEALPHDRVATLRDLGITAYFVAEEHARQAELREGLARQEHVEEQRRWLVRSRDCFHLAARGSQSVGREDLATQFAGFAATIAAALEEPVG